MSLNSSPKNKNRALNSITVAVAFIVALLIYHNFAKGIASLNMQKAEELKKNDLSRKIVAIEKEISPYREFLNKKDMNKIINTINVKAAESGVRILSLKPLAEASSFNYVTYPFEINVITDSYNAIGKFVSSLENSPEVFIIERIIIAGPQQGNESGIKEDAFEKGKLAVNLRVNTVMAK